MKTRLQSIMTSRLILNLNRSAYPTSLLGRIQVDEASSIYMENSIWGNIGAPLRVDEGEGFVDDGQELPHSRNFRVS